MKSSNSSLVFGVILILIGLSLLGLRVDTRVIIAWLLIFLGSTKIIEWLNR